jgi:hypothetical protein
MKLKITLLFAFVLLMTTNSYAGFPVTRTATTTTTEVGSTAAADLVDASPITSPAAVASDDTFLIALLLWIFLWPVAAHRWYLGSPIGWNILFIVTFGGFGIWAFVDFINILTKNFPGL